MVRPRRAGSLLALVGIAVLAHPLYLFPYHGQVSVFVHEYDPVGSDRPDGDVVAYADLPPDAREALDAARDGETYVLWHGEDDAAIDALEDGQYVRRDGTYVAYDVAHRGGLLTGIGTALRVLLTGLGTIAFVVGSFGVRTGRVRSLTPERALVVPAVGVLAVVATNVYDAAVSGASPAYSLAAEGFGGVALVAVPLGIAVRQRDRRAAGIAVGGAVASSVVLLGVLGADPVLAAVVGLPTGVASLAVGVLLADPDSP